MLADHPARQLLDFSQKLDITLLDNVVNSMYHDIGSQVRAAPVPRLAWSLWVPQVVRTAAFVLHLKMCVFLGLNLDDG